MTREEAPSFLRMFLSLSIFAKMSLDARGSISLNKIMQGKYSTHLPRSLYQVHQFGTIQCRIFYPRSSL